MGTDSAASTDSKVRAFVDSYRSAFETFDVARIAAFFAFPLLIAGDAETVTVTVVSGPDEWVPVLERLIEVYGAVGVASAEAVDTHVTPVSDRLAHVKVDWRLRRNDGTPLYEFTAGYSVGEFGDGMRITAIAHNEGPRLAAALQSG